MLLNLLKMSEREERKNNREEKNKNQERSVPLASSNDNLVSGAEDAVTPQRCKSKLIFLELKWS